MKSRKIINVNSRERITGTDSHFSFRVDLPPHNKFNRITVLQAVIPKTYYTVRAGQNYFTLIEDGFTTMISVPPANYNRRSLARIVEQLLSFASPHGLQYAITFPNAAVSGDDGKYYFQVFDSDLQPETDIQVSIAVPTNAESDMFELLGFDSGTVNHFSNSKLRSTNVVKIQSEDVIRIHSNACNNAGNDILLEIYATSTPTFSNVVWTTPDPLAYSMPLAAPETSIFEFSLTNEDNRILDLNGLNFNCQILLFEEDDTLKNVGKLLLNR